MPSFYSFKTPLGEFGIMEESDCIIRLFLPCQIPTGIQTQKTQLLIEGERQIMEYLRGDRTRFSLPINMAGTPFQQSVWQALERIPYGETATYKQIAKNIGNEKACRAVGMANNKNPLPIIIPCHRIIGSNNSLVGYAGGLDLKQKLLEIENQRAI